MIINMPVSPETMTRACYGQLRNKQASVRELWERYDVRALTGQDNIEEALCTITAKN